MTEKNKSNAIAYLGLPGSNSDLACRQVYPYMDTVGMPSFEQVFEAVEQGKVAIGLIPTENSQSGRVAEIHSILPNTNLHIVAEYFQRIHHCLLGPKNATLETIKTVYSHPQGLLQCRENIKKLGLKTEVYSNTAQAASDVAKWNDNTKAAIASPLAGELYGLKLLKDKMEDDENNTTVFVAISKEPIDPDPKKGPVLTSLVFSIRNIPAALYKALGGFATNGVNLQKIESYIPGGVSSSAQFLATFEGHPQQKNVQLALEELGFFTRKVKVLGVYYADKARTL